ncbi:MAG: sensor histidine kinase [Spirochaetaceae bacterium]|nr:sensor histidine kinase [Spirochaetaceae bacterium]
MQLDMRTLVVAQVLVFTLLCLVSFLAWRAEKGIIKGAGFWFVGFVAIAIGTGGIAFRGILPGFVTIVAANAVAMGGIIFQAIGVYKLRGRRLPIFAAALLWFLAAGGFMVFGWLRPSLLPRAMILSAVIALSCGAAAVLLLGERDPHLRQASLQAAAAFGVFSFVYALRLALLPSIMSGQDWFSSSVWDPVFSLLTIVLVAGLAFAQQQLIAAHYAARLAAAAEERGLLLREMSHRVKNNLALVESLISLEAGRVQDPFFGGVLRNLGSRVRSIGLVHERLYRVDTGGRVKMDEYLALVAAGFRGAAPRVELRTVFEPLHLEAERAVPVGLLLNELLANAFKHAFPKELGERGGRIDASLRSAEGMVLLSVRDDGTGFPAEPGAGLGSLIVESLAMQLGGELTRRNEGGGVVELSFPLKP